MNVTINDVAKHTTGEEREVALFFLNKMCQVSFQEPDYARNLYNWLNHGDTVLLRDTLMKRFEHHPKMVEVDAYYPWHEVWTTLDSARLHASDEVNNDQTT